MAIARVNSPFSRKILHPNHPVSITANIAMESPPTQEPSFPIAFVQDFYAPFKNTLLRVIPTMTLFCHSFGHLIWKYMAQIYDILFWHSIWHLF